MQGPIKLTEDVIDSFFNSEISILSRAVGDEDDEGEMIVYDPDNFLYNISPRGGLIRLPRGGWTMMDAIVPEVLKHIHGPIVEIGMGESSEILSNHAYQMGRIC